MKKRILSFVMLLVFTICIPIVCFAQGDSSYSLPDVGMSITIPSNYHVLTRDISSSDPALSFFGLSKNECVKLLEDGNIYLDAVDPDVTTEIVVTMTENIISDMNLLPNSTIDTMLDTLIEMYSKTGIIVDSTSYYQHKQAKFIVFGIHQNSEDGTTYGIQYYTVYNYKAINVTLYSYNGPISDWDQFMFQINTIDSVEFDSPPQTLESAAKTDPFIYTDSKTGVSFTVPANWIQKETSKPRETIDVLFDSTDGEAIIMFGSIDAWSQLTESERRGYSRSDFNNSVFTNEDLKELASIYGATDDSFHKETIAGTEYIVFDASGAKGLVSVTLTEYVTYKNGYMFLYQYSGGNAEAHKDDLLELLRSVDYSSVNTAQRKADNEKEPISNDHGIIIVIAAVLIVGLSIFAYFMVKKRKAPPKHNVDISGSSNNPLVVDTALNQTEPVQVIDLNRNQTNEGYCPNCGKAIPQDSIFCQYCGKKL